MGAAIASAKTLVEKLRYEVDAYPRSSADDREIADRASEIVREGNTLVETILQAQQELESELDGLDAVQAEVSARLSPKIEQIYELARTRMNGKADAFDALYDSYQNKLQATALGAPPIMKRSRAVGVSVDSFGAIATVNGVFIVGVLFALACSRLEFASHGATFLGFVAGALGVIVARALRNQGSAPQNNDHDRHVQTLNPSSL